MQPVRLCFWHENNSMDGLKATSCITVEQVQWMCLPGDSELVVGDACWFFLQYKHIE